MNESQRPKAVIFGASQAGLAAYHHLKDEYAVIGFCDNDVNKQGQRLAGVMTVAPNELPRIATDYILIASEYAESIENQLQQLSLNATIQTLPARLIKFSHFQDDPEVSQIAINILHLVCAHLQRTSVRYYVDAGTLLGIIRDNALIPWDDDLDIAIHAEDLEQTRQSMQPLLQQLATLTGESWQCTEQTNIKVFGAVPKGAIRAMKLSSNQPDSKLPMMDFFIKYIDGQWMDYCLSSRGFRMPALHFEYTEKVIFAGQQLAIPAQVEDYLARHYGDWRTPKKDWNLSDLQNTTLF
ncbi:LicD family protein [Neptunicella sp.]|uniref:LicD family protein n=1 Tax=Neptunicella sp. TaxID=2125986 RepID=UPI003F68FE53